MEKKKIIITQLVILLAFCVAAMGSAGSTDLVKAAGQGAACGGGGYTFVGYYNTKSECSSACASRRYTSWCSGQNTTACYCK